jgi:hypothetical protein
MHVTRVFVVRAILLTALVVTTALGASGCKAAGGGGRSPSYLIIDSLSGAPGVAQDTFFAFLLSDVETVVKRTVNGQQVEVPTIFNDPGRATVHLGLKDPGSLANPTAPSQINAITLTRYHVSFRRADGRNTPGVDVPYGFDGAVTGTVAGADSVQIGFELVRHQMKEEPPLRNLVGGGGARHISTIAEVTFYGRDQAGNEVTASGSITVDFADFGDPE